MRFIFTRFDFLSNQNGSKTSCKREQRETFAAAEKKARARELDEMDYQREETFIDYE